MASSAAAICAAQEEEEDATILRFPKGKLNVTYFIVGACTGPERGFPHFVKHYLDKFISF